MNSKGRIGHIERANWHKFYVLVCNFEAHSKRVRRLLVACYWPEGAHSARVGEHLSTATTKTRTRRLRTAAALEAIDYFDRRPLG